MVENTPSETKPTPKKAKITARDVAARFLENHGRSVEAQLRLGAYAHKFILARLRAAVDAGERRTMRATAIHGIESDLHAAGLRGDSCNVSRHIRCAAVWAIVGDKKPVCPTWRALVELCPLVKRDNANDAWGPVGDEKQRIAGMELYARACKRAVSVDAIRDDVRVILNRKRKVRRDFSPVEKLIARLKSISSPADLARIQTAVEKKLAELYDQNQSRAA